MEKTKQCPACKEEMKADASTCPHCGHTQLNKWLWMMIVFFMLPFICCILFLIVAMFSPV